MENFDEAELEDTPAPYAKFARQGFKIGSSIPVGLGILIILREKFLHTFHLPGTAVCGMPILGAVCLILIVGPLAGFVGAFIGATIAWFYATPTEAVPPGRDEAASR